MSDADCTPSREPRSVAASCSYILSTLEVSCCNMHFAAICGHPAWQMPTLYFCPVVYLFFLPNLSGHRLDVYHSSTHGVALVQI